MKVKPDAVMRAIRIAQAIGSRIDPSFGTIPMPNAGEGVPLLRKSGGQVDRATNLARFQQGNHELVPHVVYHGTDRDIRTFDTEQPRRIDAGTNHLNTDTGWYGKGHYFTPHTRSASRFATDYRMEGEHGPNVIPAHLALKNPFIVKVPRSSSGADAMDRAMDEAGFPQTSDPQLRAKGKGERRPSEQTKMLMDRGHDGVIVLHQYGIKDPEEEKAAKAREQAAWEQHKAAHDAYIDAFSNQDNDLDFQNKKNEFIRTRHEYHEAKEAAGGKYHPHELVVFQPNQIKSAIGNSGQYDTSQDDITMARGGKIRDVRLPLHYPKPHMADGGAPDFSVDNAMSVFPKPQRMWDEDMPGGAYLSMPDKQDVTGHRAAQAAIGIDDSGKPYFHASRDEVDETGTPGKGSATVKTNLFKQKAGWKWKDAPEGKEHVGTIVSVEHRGKHHYVMKAHFPKGVDLTRYADAPSEPRLRPTTRGNVELGPQAGSILVRGREHPVYEHAIVRAEGGRVGYDDGGANQGRSPIIVVHGGSDFEDIDPSRYGSGEPGGIRPLGNGLYGFLLHSGNMDEASRAVDFARHYATKYGRGKKAIHAFTLDPENIETGSHGPIIEQLRGKAPSPERKMVDDAYNHADSLPSGPERKAAFEKYYALDAAHPRPHADVKYERLPVGLTEGAIHSPHLLNRIGKINLDQPDEDLLNIIHNEMGAKRKHYADGGSDDDDNFDLSLPQDFYSTPDTETNLYSKAADVAFNAPMKHATPDEWKNYLLKRGVKQSEFRWSDYDKKFAPRQGANRPEPVTREEIADHFYRNQPRIKHTVLEGDRDARYQDYTMYGGDNYREMLLHDPSPVVSHQHPHWEGYEEPDEDEEERNYYDEDEPKKTPDIPNVYVHLRTKDRKNKAGESVHHIEELQSDWGQAGRKGFRQLGEMPPPEKTEARDRRNAYFRDLVQRAGVNPNLYGGSAEEPSYTSALEAAQILGEMPTLFMHNRAVGRELVQNRQFKEKPIEGPHVGSTNEWTDLGLKHALSNAAHEGHDYLAWTPGEDQANRYSLEKQIGKLVHTPAGGEGDPFEGLHKIMIYNHSGKLTDNLYLSPEELESYIGKDLAKKVVNREGVDVSDQPYEGEGFTERHRPDTRELSGLDLKVGGEGMRKYYDEILPKRLLKLARMHDPDAELTTTDIEHPASFGFKTTSLPAIKITPRMRESIKRHGFAHMAEGGEVEGQEDHPLTNPVYHGVKEDHIGSPMSRGLEMEMFDAKHPSLNWDSPNAMALALGPHVARDPNIAGDPFFTTEVHPHEYDERGVFKGQWGLRLPWKAKGKVALLNTLPDEKFFPVKQEFRDDGRVKSSKSNDDVSVNNTIYEEVMKSNPELAHKILLENGMPDDVVHHIMHGISSGEPFSNGFSSIKFGNLRDFLDYTNILPTYGTRKKVIKEFRKIMRDRGYAGLSYINTDAEETRNAKDKKCYIVFPQRDKETGWYPLRFQQGAEYDPENKGKPGLHLASGGEADGYEFGGSPENPMMSEAASENVPSVTVSPRPGKMGGSPVREGRMFDPETGSDVEPWNYATPQGEGQAMPPPVQHPVFNEPRMDRLHKATHKIFKSKGFNDLTEKLTGLRNFNVTPIVGTWKGEIEPSFVLHHPDMTPEAAEKLSHLLGFGFMQDAAVTGHHNPNPENEGIPSVYMGRDKKLSRADLNRIHKAAREEGLDFSQTKDGRGVKFMHFGDEGDEFNKFAESAKRIADKAKLPYMHHVNTSGDLQYAQDYLKGIFGAHEGEAGESGLQPGSSRPSDLFGRVVTHLVAPYAKAVAAEGYRLSPERLRDTYGLSDEEHEQVRKALLPGSQDRTVIPLMEGKEKLDMRPTGDKGKATVGDALFALQNRAAAKGQIEPGDYSPEAMKKIASDIAKEVNYHVDTADKSAIGWYDAALKKAMNAYEDVFPELKTDADKRMLFHAILGITSQGNDVHSNSIHTARLYNYLRNGDMTMPEGVEKLKGTFGDKTRAIEQNLLKFHHLVDTNGYDTMRDLFGQKKSVSEWNKILKNTPELHGPDGKPLSMQGGANQKVTGWTVFGPKIGSFINNLSGDYSTLTADLWFSRTWNRLLGHNFIHTPLAEAKQYQDFRDAMIAEHAKHNPDNAMPEAAPFKTSNGKITAKPWEHGNDVANMSRDDMEGLVNDPEKMLSMAKELNDKYRKGGYKQKSDLRRRAKNWIENRELPVAAPRGDMERDFQQNTVEQAQKLLRNKYGKDISVADIQAALWFLEKDLFGKMGVASEKAAPADYADAAKNTIDLINNKKLYHVKSRAPEQIPLKKSTGGGIDKAILIAMRAKKRSPIAFR